MKLYSITALIVLCTIYSCGSKPSKREPANTNSSTQFYPINQFLHEQIKDVDSTPYFLYQITIKDGIKDSSVIDKKTFDAYAAFFVENDISDSLLKPSYKENVFEDLTTDSYTLTYTATAPSLPVESINVLLNRDNNRVKHIFINKAQYDRDSAILVKLGWKTDRNFYINRIIQYKDGKESTEQIKVVWNDMD